MCTEEVCREVQEEVAREKARAEKEWVEERESSDDDSADDADDAAAEGDDSPHTPNHLHPTPPHHRLTDSITPPTSHHGTGNEDTFKALLSSSSSPRKPPMSPDRYARIASQLSKKPSTLDSTLDHLTDLHSVTFVDCGSVALKGIAGPTRIYQVSSVSLTGRRWEPALRAKVVKPDGGMVVGDSAPLAPPCVPLTLTLYNKHSIPVQIRRNILRNRRLQKQESVSPSPPPDSPTVVERMMRRGSDSVVGKGAMKGDGVRKAQRASVRFAGTAEDGLEQLVKAEERRMMSERRGDTTPPREAEHAGSTVDLSLSLQDVPVVSPLPSPKEETKEAVTEARRSPVPLRLSGSSALASSLLQSRIAFFQQAQAPTAKPTSPRPNAQPSSPQVRPSPGDVAVKPSTTPSTAVATLSTSELAGPTAAVAVPASPKPAPAPLSVAALQIVVGSSSVRDAPNLSATATSTPQSPALSATARAFIPSSPTLDSVPLGNTNLAHSVSSPPSPGRLSNPFLVPSRSPKQPPSHRHQRGASHDLTTPPQRNTPRGGKHSRRANRSRDVDRMAEVYSAAFDAEARQGKANAGGRGPVMRGSAHRLNQPRYATVRPISSAPSGSGSGYGSGGWTPAADGSSGSLPESLFAQQAQIRAQVVAQQQAHAYNLHLLYQQQQALQAQWLFLQQQQQQQQANASQPQQSDAVTGPQLFFPPAQTPPFGLSPAVSSAVPYSYSFPAGSQWSPWG